MRDFETGNLVFEIYTFGEENVVIPIEAVQKNSSGRKEQGIEKLAKDRILQVFKKYDPETEVRIISPTKAEVAVSDSVIPRVIGKGGSQIKEIEELLGLRIDVKPRSGSSRESDDSDDDSSGEELQFDYKEKANSIDMFFDSSDVGKEVAIFVDGEKLFGSKIGEKSRLKISKKSEVGKKISYALRSGRNIRIVAI